MIDYDELRRAVRRFIDWYDQPIGNPMEPEGQCLVEELRAAAGLAASTGDDDE